DLICCSLFLPLPDRDPKGRLTVIIRTGGFDAQTTHIEQVFRATNMISDIMCDEEEDVSVTGLNQILDMAGSTMSHTLQMTPAIVKKAMTVWQVRI
ncbi:CRAL-TRIO lipid binding domain, partial [Trinorchestia longiramus]